MADYFEKLGNLLNEALENGEIPHSETDSSLETEKTNDFSEDIRNKNYNFSSFFDEKSKKATGEVIKEPLDSVKMYKYTKIMHITPEIQAALSTLDIAYPFTTDELNKKYHELLKLIHPDTSKNTIQDTQIVYKNRQLPTINQVQAAYSLLKELCV